jgi:hypothetical protein
MTRTRTTTSPSSGSSCSTTLTLEASVCRPAVAKRLRSADVYVGKRRVKRLSGAAVRRSFTLRRLSAAG